MAGNSILRDALDTSLHDFAETDKAFAELVDFLEAVEAKRRRRADSKHSAKIAAVADAQQPTKTVAGARHVAQPLQQVARCARRLSFLFPSSFALARLHSSKASASRVVLFSSCAFFFF